MCKVNSSTLLKIRKREIILRCENLTELVQKSLKYYIIKIQRVCQNRYLQIGEHSIYEYYKTMMYNEE